MKTIILLIASLASCSVAQAQSDIPPSFALLSNSTGQILAAGERPPMQTFQSPWKPSGEEMRRGFAIGRVDIMVAPRPDWLWPEPQPEKKIDLLLSRGEYRAAALAVRTLRPIQGLRFSASKLTSTTGAVIPASQVDIRTVQYLSTPVDAQRKTFTWSGSYLEKRASLDLEANWTCWSRISVYAPVEALAGLYRGTVTISATGGAEVEVPLTIRVLPHQFTYPAGAWGAYLPGHLYHAGKGKYVNYAKSDWKAENLERYFAYWKTRGFNSPSLFHLHPDLAYKDGQVVARFPDLEKVMQAGRKAGLDGPLCLDTTFMEYWANTVALRLDALQAKGEEVPADLNITGEGGIRAYAYPERAKAIYAETVQQLVAFVKTQQWPGKVVYLAAQEVANNPYEIAQYETFFPVLRNIVGDDAFLIDNGIGYGNDNKIIDRAARDKIKIRQYNNWTATGLRAVRDLPGAELWNYNGGWSRGIFGLYNLTTGSTGNHQWADQWQNPPADGSTSYQVSRIQDDGVVTSIEMERAHEGLCDIAYYQKLQHLISALKDKGLKDEANKGQSVLSEISRDVPLNRYEAAAFLERLSEQQFEMRRWKVMLAIEKAQTALEAPQPSPGGMVQGQPSLIATADSVQTAVRGDKILRAVRVEQPIELDGKETEAAWAVGINSTGNLGWLGATEAAMRARAGSVEEFNKMPPPSSARGSIAYGDQGIYVLLSGNHMQATAKRLDDDPNLWQDDCYEIFFQPDTAGGQTVHLIVSSSGRRTLRRGGQVVPCEVQVATRSPINASGGTMHEVFILWGDLGLEAAPLPGATWKVNIAREFHSWRQVTTWAPVQAFLDKEIHNWGMLVFEGTLDKVLFTGLGLGSRRLGKSNLSGNLSAVISGQNLAQASVQLCDEAGTVQAEGASNAQGRFSFTYEVPYAPQGAQWQLRAIGQNGEILSGMPFTIPAQQQAVVVTQAPPQVISGQRLLLNLTIAIGDLSAVDHPLIGSFKNAYGHELALAPLPLQSRGEKSLWIDTSGLQPGEWQLDLTLGGAQTKLSAARLSVTVLASPFAVDN